jgi:hypothetical protein
MPVFQVYLNGKKLRTAGIRDTGVVGAHVSWVRRRMVRTRANKPSSLEEELRLHVGGLITPADEHVRWVDRKLKIGDEIRIVIATHAPVDRPRTRKRSNPAEDLRQQKRYVRQMARKFGWRIQE